VFVFFIFISSNKVSTTSLQYSFPLSETISNGKPFLHNHHEKRAEPKKATLFSGIATCSAYLKKLSVIHSLNLSKGIVLGVQTVLAQNIAIMDLEMLY
jgi:hypothetical protein